MTDKPTYTLEQLEHEVKTRRLVSTPLGYMSVPVASPPQIGTVKGFEPPRPERSRDA